MKLKIKRRITVITFLLLAVVSIVGFIVFMLNVYVAEHGEKNIYQSTELIQMKRGEKVAFSKANEHFEQVKKKYGKTFQVHSQGAYHLSIGAFNSNPTMISSMIYIDEEGYINAVKTGIYQLEYTFAIGERLDEKDGEYTVEGYKTFTFTALVCVYEGEEDKFLPLPDDPHEITYDYQNPTNYILTKDITWNADGSWTLSSLYGTLINPYGYTLTWNVNGEDRGRGNIAEALIGENSGYIDGLKVKVVNDAETPITRKNFYGLVERNYGVLKNCEIEGTIYLNNPEEFYDASYFYALPQHGFSYNNEARITVYSNSNIYPYNTEGFGAPDLAKRLWRSENNKVYLDAWYYTNEVKAQRRAVETIEATEINSNVCEHLVFGKATGEEKTVTLQVPIMAERVGEPNYQIISWTEKENSPLEINKSWWKNIRWGSDSNIDVYSNLEVKYWLVNGEKVDNLNEFVITEDVKIEPFVQYKETKIANPISSKETLQIERVYNTEDVLDLSDLGFGENKEISTSLYCLGAIFADPRCVRPSIIHVGKNCNVDQVVLSYYECYLSFLLEYLQEGGQLIVDGENPYVSFIDGKAFCNAEGTELYYYFEGKGETEVVIHPQIEAICNENAFWNGSNYEKLHLTNVKSINQKIGDDLQNLKEINLGKELDTIKGGSSGDNVYHFLSRMPALTKVEVEEGHLTLKSQDSFVSMDIMGRAHLLYAPKTLTGEVRIPEGIVTAGGNCFSGSGITHLVFPDSFGQFNGRAVVGMEKLEKITFGTCSYLCFTDYQAELPSLTSIVFNGVEYIDGDLNTFALANIDTIVLPDNLEKFVDVFLDCKAYQISDSNPIWKTVDGVLYNKETNDLVQYPKNKQGDSYTVLEGTLKVDDGSFYETSLKEVIFPTTCTQVAPYAFRNSSVESVEFKARGTIWLFSSAFYGCKNLLKVTLQEDVKLFTHDSVFRGCESLKEFPYENVANIGGSAFRETGIEYFEIGDGIFLGESAFRDSQLKEVAFGATELQYINEYAFANTPLESVSLHSSITSIADNAFSGCVNLKTIDLSNIKKIGASAFEGSGIQSVQSERIETLGERSFVSCENLTTVSLPNVLSIPEGAFAGSGVTVVSMPNVYAVGNGAFSDCEDLVTVQFKDSVSVGCTTFMNCAKLQELPFVITSVDIQSFEGCTSLKTATIRANIEERCEKVFSGCTALEEVTIEGENIAIGKDFFAGCKALKKVFITDMGTGNGVISSLAFGIPSQKTEVYLNVSETFLWKGKILANITVYVPTAHLEKFKSEWLAEERQLKGYDFNKQENN